VAPPVGVCAHVLDSYMGMHGPVGVATLVCMGSATDQHCSNVNHYGVSFGLDDRHDDPYCDRFL
jgi:hypothetical protein